VTVHVHRLAVRPDAADAGDRALAERHGEAGIVEVFGGLDLGRHRPLAAALVVVLTSSRKSVAQMMLPPIRMRPKRRGMTAPSVEEVMRSCRAARPRSLRRGSEDTIQLSTTDPMVDPMKPPMAHRKSRGWRRRSRANRGADGAENKRCHVWSLNRGEQEGEGDLRAHVGVSGSSITPSRS
jgi:hypothetical protein